MLPLFFATVIGAASATAAVGAESQPGPIAARGSSGDGIVRLPVNGIPDPTPKTLRTRQNSVSVENQKSGTRYAIDIEVGTPPQNLTLILDTGSPDTWVNPECSNANVPSDCRSFPQFDPSKSSSLNKTGVTERLAYGIGNATIDFVYETVTIGSATIKHQVIGIASSSQSIPLGILGMSPPVNGANQYPYVLDTMVSQNLIKSRAFSLDLRGIDSPAGAIIFGGVDTGKFIGALAKRPMLSPQQSPQGADRYYLTLTGVGLTLPDGSVTQSDELAVPVFLDSGSTFSQLPTAIYQAFADSFSNAQYDPSSGYTFVPCSVTQLNGTVDFYFGTKAIKVPLSDVVWQVDEYCVLGILPSQDQESILGDTFLRAAYVVFDQDNRNIHLAQAADCGSSLVAIGSGSDAVPSSTGLCTAVPTPSRVASASLDVTSTHAPTGTFTGTAPTVAVGPGPESSAGSQSSSAPAATGTGGAKNAAGRGVEVGLGLLGALAGVNVLAWML